MSNELMIANYDTTALTQAADVMSALHDELGPDARPTFAFAKTPTGGMTSWQIKENADDEDPEITKAIEGVILYSHRSNVYWSSAMGTTDDKTPDCRSMDGITGVSRDGETLDCATCPNNQFGSGREGRGKACKNCRRVYILRQGDMLPIRIDLSPTGLKNYDRYVESMLLPKKKGQTPQRLQNVVTKIGVKTETMSTGDKYSVPTFECVGALPEEARKHVQSCAEGIRRAAEGYETIADEDLPL